MNNQQTDNSYLEDKILLRINSIPAKKVLNVIDAYHGRGTIWKNIQKRYNGKINILKIDKEQKDTSFVLIGDNIKYLSALNLKQYDVIDMDAYGVPYEQLKIVLSSGFKGICFATFIQSVMGQLPKEFLMDINYTKEMIDKCPTLFAKNGYNKFLYFLSINGIKKVKVRKNQRKVYLAFQV